MCVVLGGVNVEFVFVVFVPFARREVLERVEFVLAGYYSGVWIGASVVKVFIYIAEQLVETL